MNCSITGSNAFHPTLTIPSILALRDRVSCLSKDTLRRLTVRSDSNTIAEDGVLPLTAEATFTISGIIDVTEQSVWSLDPPASGIIDAFGRFTPNSVDFDTCVTVSAAYTLEAQTFLDDKVLVIQDLDSQRAIIASTPPISAIDARQPTAPNRTTPLGWQTIDLSFNGENCLVTENSLVVSEIGGTSPAPLIEYLEPVDSQTIRLQLAVPMEPSAWTSISELDSNAKFWVGYLPGDVDSSRESNPADVAALIQSLNGKGPVLPDRSTDLDRSGRTTPADLLRLIDILGGGGTYEVWNGRTLPPNS